MSVKKLSIKNFGPINEAEIDISPLTVFVGKKYLWKIIFIHAYKLFV